jgi:hypothetical protein
MDIQSHPYGVGRYAMLTPEAALNGVRLVARERASNNREV